MVCFLYAGRRGSTKRFILVQSTTPPGSPTRGGTSVLPTTPAASKSFDASSSPTKRRYVPDTADAEAVKKIKLSEIELRDRTTVLHGIKANVSRVPLTTTYTADFLIKNFTNVKNMFQEKLKKLKDGGKAAAQAASTPDSALQAKKSRNYPIFCLMRHATDKLYDEQEVKPTPLSSFPPPPHPSSRCTTSNGSSKTQPLRPHKTHAHEPLPREIPDPKT